MVFLLYINTTKPNALAITSKTAEILRNSGNKVFLDKELKDGEFIKALDMDIRKAHSSNIKDIDMIISIGGDGTLIHASKCALEINRPILGINAGRLGFLTGMDEKELTDLKNLAKGEYIKRDIMVMEAFVGNKKYTAINDVVLDRDNSRGVIDITVSEGANEVIEYKADAVLFSTPLGSTAYAFSNGGPIADSELKFISMAPISPHSFNSRVYLFKDDVELTAKIGESQSAYLLIDGKESGRLENGETIRVKKSNRRLSLIYIREKLFYESVRNKFLEEMK